MQCWRMTSGASRENENEKKKLEAFHPRGTSAVAAASRDNFRPHLPREVIKRSTFLFLNY